MSLTNLCKGPVAKPSAFEKSVDHLIDQFAEDVHRTLALNGVHKASDLTPAAVRQRGRLSTREQQQEARM